MSSSVQEIKDKIDIVDFLGRYLKLQKTGKYYRALCPFHKENKPSFMVSPERQAWYCFGCQNGGDIFTFLQKYENLEFYEALKILAEKAGVDLKRYDPNFTKEIEIIYEINANALDFFRKNLEINSQAIDYLKKRGLKKETFEEFNLGYASSAIDSLFVNLINRGYRPEDVNRAGLGFRTERGIYFDRFRGRIIYPIFNFFGKVIGFSGRILPGQEAVAGEAKYINSPETPIFKKGKALYGFHSSKNFIRQENKAFLVEGQMDFLMAWQEGIKFAVATSGTALTPDHLTTLKRYTENLILNFDADEAGEAATERSIDLANAYDFDVKVLNFKGSELANFKDIAELAKEKPAALKTIVNQVVPAMEFYFLKYLPQPIAKASKYDIRKVLSKIKTLSSPIEQSQWLKKLSEKTKIEEKILNEELRFIKKEKEPTPLKENKPEEMNLSRREFLSQRLITLASAREDEKNILVQASPYLVSDKNFSPLESFSFNMIKSEEAITEELNDLIKQLKIEWLKERRQELISDIKNAELANNQEELAKLLEDFCNINKETFNSEKII